MYRLTTAILSACAAAAASSSCPQEAPVVVAQLSDGGIVCEGVSDLNGTLLYVGGSRDGRVFHKRQYSQQAAGTWGGLGQQHVLTAGQDVLAQKLLGMKMDPDYDEVLNLVQPFLGGWGANGGMGYAGQHTFVATRSSTVEAVFDHLGDVGMWAGYPRPPTVIGAEWNASTPVWEGLLGGSLLCLVYSYQVSPTVRWEMNVVPLDGDGNAELTVYFRFSRIANGTVTKQVFFDTYEYNPALDPSGEIASGVQFFEAVVSHADYWAGVWAQEGMMQVEVPFGRSGSAQVLLDQSVHSLARDMVTRHMSVWPRYGVCGDPGGCAYGDPHNNGFQETFTSSLLAALEWGLYGYAKSVVANYLKYYIRKGGGVHYRGLEMAQEARMLTVIAAYYEHTKDGQTVAAELSKVEGVAQLLLSRIRKARKLDRSDPRYGMPVGNDEADMFNQDVGANAGKTELPFYSIATETVRGFRDIGAVFVAAPQMNTTFGQELLAEAATLATDLKASMAKSRVQQNNMPCLPYVAGAGSCSSVPHAASDRDSEAWRTYSEMLYSGVLDKDSVAAIYAWSVNNSKMTRIGIPSGTGSTCCGNMLQTFTVQGWGHGLLLNDMVKPFLLQLYALSGHAYTRGTWTAPEETALGNSGMPYCPPSQLTVPLNFRWMLLLDDVDAGQVWLGKGLPRAWVAAGSIRVQNAASRYGRVSFSYDTAGNTITVTAALNSPPNGTYLRVRLPSGRSAASASVNGTSVPFNSSTESVYLGPERNRASWKICVNLA